MVTRNFFAATLIIGSIYIAACSNTVDSGGANPVDNGVMPLQVGNSWTYERFVRDNPNDPFTVDTITIRINRSLMQDHEIWYEPSGYPDRQLWTNRGEEFWVWPESGEPYKFYKHFLGYRETWPGPNDDFTIAVMPHWSYYEVPGKGAFVGDHVSVGSGRPNDPLDEQYEYVIVPRLGILQRLTMTRYGLGSLFASERLQLIDFSLPDPPDGSYGEITFRYYIDRSNLLPPYTFKVELSLGNPPFGILWYGVNADGQPEIPVGKYSPLQVFREHQAVQQVIIQYVPCGTHTLTIDLWRMDGSSRLSSITVDNISVENGQTIDLGNVYAFPPPSP
jgi:hypothetical protein